MSSSAMGAAALVGSPPRCELEIIAWDKHPEPHNRRECADRGPSPLACPPAPSSACVIWIRSGVQAIARKPPFHATLPEAAIGVS